MYIFIIVYSVLATANAIEGGKDASNTDFPYQVELEIWIPQPRFLCNGAILSKNWVVTTAKYFSGESSDSSSFIVRAGTNVTGTGGSLHEVEEIVIHKKGKTLALLRVNPPFVLDETRQPVELSQPIDKLTPANISAFAEYRDIITETYEPKRLQHFEGYVGVGAMYFWEQPATFELRDEGSPVVDEDGRLVGIACPWDGKPRYWSIPIFNVDRYRKWTERTIRD